MNRYKNLAIALLALYSGTNGIAQQGVAQIISESINEKSIPGLAFIVAQNGEIMEEGYHGLANIELGVPVSEKSVFAIASMSKAYTAAAILLLVEAGLLSFEDGVRRYIPEAPESWDAITIRHLLTHSSGLVDDWELYSWDQSNALFLKTQTDGAFLKHLFDHQLKFTPGTSMFYSSGPFVLGVVIERITGKYYGDYLQQYIFNPLSLTETYVDHPYKIIPNRVSGYFDHDTSEMNTGVSGLGNGILIAPVAYGRADVGIRTTARDLLKFYMALLNGKLLNEQSKDIMFSYATLENGNPIPTAPGWMNWPLAGRFISQHSGAFRTGFSSQAFIIPEDNFIVILLTNISGGTNFPLVQKIAATYYKAFRQLSERAVIEDNRPNLTNDHLGLFRNMASDALISTVISDKFPESYLSSNLKTAISKTESIVFLGEDHIGSKEVHLFGVEIHTFRYYKLIGDRTLYTTVWLDKNDKIVFVDYPETE